jgi:hypothetical protein
MKYRVIYNGQHFGGILPNSFCSIKAAQKIVDKWTEYNKINQQEIICTIKKFRGYS